MYEIPCRCGKVKQNYKMNIGPFFINDCCIEAGYDHLGNLTKEEPKLREDGVDPQMTVSGGEKSVVPEDLTQSEEVQQEAEKLEIVDDPALDTQEDESEDEVAKEVNEAIVEESKTQGKRGRKNKDKV